MIISYIIMDIITMVIFQFCFFRGNYIVERVVKHHGFYSYEQEASHSAHSRTSHTWYEYVLVSQDRDAKDSTWEMLIMLIPKLAQS